MTSSQGFNFVREYWIDAWQRSVRMLDVLRERGNRKKMVIASSERASAVFKPKRAEETEREVLIDRLRLPSPRFSDEAIIDKAAAMVKQAVENGPTSVQVFRFPHEVPSGNGAAIDEAEKNCETTLTGVPREIYDFRQRQPKPLGYRIRYEIIDCVGGTPGGVRATLNWPRSVTLLNTSEGGGRPGQAHRVAGRGQGLHPPRSRSREWQLAGRAADLCVQRRRGQHHAGRQAVDHFDQCRGQSQEPDGVGRLQGPACASSTLGISRRSRPVMAKRRRGATDITHLRKAT
jgi:hypothetical protein